MKLAASTLVFCVAALLSLGLVILYSSSMGQRGAPFPLMQMVWCGLGVVLAIVVAGIDYVHLKKISVPLYLLAVVLLAVVLIPGVGKKVLGAQRWFVVWGQFFQPSELAKLALIIALAHYTQRYQAQIGTFKGGIVIPGLIVGLVLALIFKEPDWGTSIVLASVSGAMLLVAGVRWRHLLPIALTVGAAAAVALMNNPVRLRRLMSWLNIEETKSGTGYQAWQSMLALGSGGLTGAGLGDGVQKFGYVPMHQSDFIFAILGEELGLVCTLGVLLAFALIVICGIRIAWRARDSFGMYLATGLTFLIGLQAFVNIGVVTSALPNKGLPLPFISRGGSNLLFMLLCVGILLSIARHSARATVSDLPVEDFDGNPEPQAP